MKDKIKVRLVVSSNEMSTMQVAELLSQIQGWIVLRRLDDLKRGIITLEKINNDIDK